MLQSLFLYYNMVLTPKIRLKMSRGFEKCPGGLPRFENCPGGFCPGGFPEPNIYPDFDPKSNILVSRHNIK
mgnify:CR=1 FL=1